MPVNVKRLGVCAGALLLFPSLAAASELDAKTGQLLFAPDAIKSWSFESADELIKANAFVVRTESGGGYRLAKVTEALS